MALRVFWGGGRRCLLSAQVEVVVIDGFSGFKSVTGEELPMRVAAWLPANSMSAAASNERSQGAQAARTTRSRRPGVRCALAAQAERLAGLFVAGVCGRRDGVITENDAILSGDVHDGVAGFLVLPCVALEPVIQLGGPAVEADRDVLAPEAPRRSRFVVEADSGSEGRGTVP